jgi:hypothetical protein
MRSIGKSAWPSDLSVRVLGVISVLTVVGGAPQAAGATSPGNERRATIFYTAGIGGTLEPCGCTSDPLGDVARFTGVVRRAGGADRVMLVDAGNLLYPSASVDAARAEGADLRATFLAKEMSKLPFAGAALGEFDVARGLERVSPKRLAANLRPPAEAKILAPSAVRTVGGIKIGVFGLADPKLARALGWQSEDPAAVAEKEATRLRAQGAEIVVVVGAFERSLARQVARTGAVDLLVVGQNTDDGMARADRVGDTFIVAPADELERVGRIDLVVREAPGGRVRLVDAGGEAAREIERASLEKRGTQIDAELARFAADKEADPAFVAQKRAEREEITVRLRELAAGFAPPTTGSYFLNQLIPLRRVLPRDPQLASALRKLDQQVGAANLRKAEPPPAAPDGRATFVGDAACVSCHKPAMTFWKTTVHARAWKTIVDDGKTGFGDCVSCHVTGFGEIGGSSLGHVKGLTNVQCETCHGPGSLHVKAEGLEEPPAVRLSTPESTCVRCHNEKHSDTFAFAAYMRDVLGPGHGAQARKKLGPGPTGRELRAAAKAKAVVAAKETVKAARGEPVAPTKPGAPRAN